MLTYGRHLSITIYGKMINTESDQSRTPHHDLRENKNRVQMDRVIKVCKNGGNKKDHAYIDKRNG